MTEDVMVGWHYRLDGHEFEQAPGVGEGQGNLACCSPWDCKDLDMTGPLNNNNKVSKHLSSSYSLGFNTAILLKTIFSCTTVSDPFGEDPSWKNILHLTFFKARIQAFLLGFTKRA